MIYSELGRTVATLVSKFTYKPETKFEVQEAETHDTIIIQFYARTRNSNDPESYATTYREAFLPVYMLKHLDPDMLGGFITEEVKRLVKIYEDHEVKEWLRWNGRPVDDPHPPPKVRVFANDPSGRELVGLEEGDDDGDAGRDRDAGRGEHR